MDTEEPIGPRQAGSLPRIIVAATGRTSLDWLFRYLELAAPLPVETHLILSGASAAELRSDGGSRWHDLRALTGQIYPEQNQAARMSSGSFRSIGMLIIPCTTNALCSIAAGLANNLVHRAADVTLKEARPLLLATERTSWAPSALQASSRLAAIPLVQLVPLPETSDDAASRATLDPIFSFFGIEGYLDHGGEGRRMDGP